MKTTMTASTPTASTTGSMMTEPVSGNCYGDSNPDAWFPDIPQGARSERNTAKLVAETRRALTLCESCPKKAECLQEGMEHENLGFGIWGGMLAGERVMLSGKTYTKLSDQGRALISYRVLAPMVRR
jgi:hypothetical protein